MNNRQEYLKKYRLENKEKYREYQRKYRKNHLSTYEKLQQKNQELKKQLEDTNEELELVRCDLHNRTSERNGYYRNIEKLENQQKEFIEYLTSYIDLLSNKPDLIEENQKDILEEILSKYKSIIGGKE